MLIDFILSILGTRTVKIRRVIWVIREIALAALRSFYQQ